MNYQSTRGENYPLDNLTFDLIAITYEKSKALEAYEKYLVDARGNQAVSDLLDRMRRQDEDFIVELQQQLGSLMTQASGTQKQATGA